MLARTVREAELEMQVNSLKRQVAKLRWAAGPSEDWGLVSADPTPMPMKVALPPAIRVIASVDILRHCEGIPSGQIALHAEAIGTEGKAGFRTYLSEGDLLSTRDSAEYLSYLHDRACRQIAAFFNKDSP